MQNTKKINPKKIIISTYLKKHNLALISTVNIKGNPEGAVIGFAENENLELIFGTFNSSRKYSNIKHNSIVALVIGWEDRKTLQYEGIAEELFDKEREMMKEMFFKKNPTARKYEHHPEERFFKVTPQWIRYTDMAKDLWEIIELKF